MKSKVFVPAQLGQKQTDVLKNGSFNFLENERYHTLVERGHVEANTGSSTESSLTAKQTSKSYEKLDTQTKEPERLQQKTRPDQFVLSSERVDLGLFAPKRYISTCYFQPKQLPVWYSETMIVKIGSAKKKFFESVYYENKLYPFHWSENMTTILPGTGKPIIFNSEIASRVEEPAFHYMSLEPQQLAAAQKHASGVDNVNLV